MAEPILLFKPIFEETAEEIVRQLIATREDVVTIWMNTPGGSISSGWTILATLNELGKEADITVLGDADSFGFFMLLFARKNKAFDSSSFTVHRAASFWENLMTDDELKIIEGRNDVIRSKMEARLNEEKFKEVTGYSFDDIFTMEDRIDVTLNAEQAKEIGLIDEIVNIDTAKREEIEGNFVRQIAALSQPKKNKKVSINQNDNNMSLLKAIFGEKDPILLGKIGESQFAYSKLEVDAKVKAIGEGEKDPINGTFEVNDKTATVVDNVITAIVEADNKQKQIDALTENIAKLTAVVSDIGKAPVVEIPKNEKKDEQIVLLTSQVEALTKTIEAAKLSISNPKLPKGEFDGEKVIEDTEMTRREKFALKQQDIYEAKQNERANS